MRVLNVLAIAALVALPAYHSPPRGAGYAEALRAHAKAPAHKKLTGWDLYRKLATKEAARQRASGLRVWSIPLVMRCISGESSGRLLAVSPSGQYLGLFQIDRSYFHSWDWHRIDVQFHLAADLYGRRGWQPWPNTMRGFY